MVIDVMLQIKNSCLISTVMKPTPFLQQVLHLVIHLLQQQGHQQMAQSLATQYSLPPWVEHNNPLLKKGLTKIIKEYVRSNQKMLAYYQNRIQPEQGVTTRKQSLDHSRKSASPKVEAKINKIKSKVASPIVSKPVQHAPTGRSSWMAKFDRPKTLQQLNEVKQAKKQEEEVIIPEKKSKGKKKIESEQYESQEDSFELQPKKKLKKQAKEEKKAAKDKKKKKKEKPKSSSEEEQDQEQQEEVVVKVPTPKKKQEIPVKRIQRQYNTYPSEVDNGPKKSFSRINIDEVGPIREQLKDNSFQAKAKFGQQADHWGQFGYDKLKDTRGDAFKKTKGRLKNRAFQGALMDINKINSIPIL